MAVTWRPRLVSQFADARKNVDVEEPAQIVSPARHTSETKMNRRK